MNWDGLITMVVFLSICLMIWSRMRKQTLRETIEEIKEQIIENKVKIE
jgi:hypothetical protein|tara:strand:+ start:1046 stop:1189 length:144 start_codon:yes stop_codon:yes gene_type:complete